MVKANKCRKFISNYQTTFILNFRKKQVSLLKRIFRVSITDTFHIIFFKKKYFKGKKLSAENYFDYNNELRSISIDLGQPTKKELLTFTTDSSFISRGKSFIVTYNKDDVIGIIRNKSKKSMNMESFGFFAGKGIISPTECINGYTKTKKDYVICKFDKDDFKHTNIKELKLDISITKIIRGRSINQIPLSYFKQQCIYHAKYNSGLNISDCYNKRVKNWIEDNKTKRKTLIYRNNKQYF